MSQPLSSLTPLHPYTAEAVIVVTRTINARSTEEVEDYMRLKVATEVMTRCEVDVTVTPVKCTDPCLTCDASTAAMVALRDANIREYLEWEAMKLADDFQRSRMKTDAGREAELSAIARCRLFAPFADFRKRVKRHASVVLHVAGCAGPDVEWSSTRGTVDGDGGILGAQHQPSLSLSHTETLWDIIAAADTASQHEWLHLSRTPAVRLQLEVVRHSGTCRSCQASYVEHGVLVTIPWAGRTLSREYLL